ncbi:MAG: carboxypeptidase regulatory-like domain-containing protein [Verrucomicrobia bacterium]|nr:carboxypeptidase regulatory-like domain-containing protein [Verrucomicrobiota bacterium]
MLDAVRLVVAALIGIGILATAGPGRPAAPEGDACAVRIELRILDENGVERALPERVPLTILQADGQRVAFPQTNAQGVVEVTLPAGTYRIRKDPYPTTPFWAEQALEVEPGTESLNAKLLVAKTSVVSLEVKVLSEEDGTPVPKARVSFTPDGEPHGCSAWTDSDGEATIANFWGHRGGILKATGRSIQDTEMRLSPAELARGSVVLRAKPSAPEPVVRATVRIEMESGASIPLEQALPGGGLPDDYAISLDAVKGETSADGLPTGALRPAGSFFEDGAVTLLGVYPGEYVIGNLTVTRRDDRKKVGTYYPVGGALTFSVPQEGAPVIEIETVFSGERKTFKVKGRVTAGQPPAGVAGARVTADGSLVDDAPQAVTAEDGSFELDAYPSFRAFRVEADGFATRVLGTYALPERAVEIQLSAVYSIEGVLAGPSGEPVPGANVSVYGARPIKEGVFSGKEGEFRIVGLPSGTYMLAAVTENLFSGVHKVEVSSNAAGLQIPLERGVRLTGSFKADEAVLEDRSTLLVFAYATSKVAVAWVQIDNDGKYTIHVPAARLLVYLLSGPGPRSSDMSVSWYALGEINPSGDQDGVDFHVTKETLEKPLDREEIPF